MGQPHDPSEATRVSGPILHHAEATVLRGLPENKGDGYLLHVLKAVPANTVRLAAVSYRSMLGALELLAMRAEKTTEACNR